jgi:hypothetical protein
MAFSSNLSRLAPNEILKDSYQDHELCAKTLQRMAEGGEIEKGGRGRYRLTPDPLAP